MNVEITDAPTAIPGLEDGTNYFVQNQTDLDIKVAVETEAPDDASAPGSEVIPKGKEFVSPEAGESVYVWGNGEGVAFIGKVA